MSDTSAQEGTSASRRSIGPQGIVLQRWWLGATVLSTVVVLISVGLVLFVRRFSGALIEQLPRGQMLATAMIATALAAYGRTAWQRAFFSGYSEGGRRQLGRLDLLVGWGSSLGLLLLAVGSCYPASRLSDCLVWLPLLISDQFWRQSFFDGGKPSPVMTGIGITENESALPHDIKLNSIAQEADDLMLQQLFRVRNTMGQEVIYGTLRAEFAAGQRTATLHVGFCPPLSHMPEVEAESQMGPDATVKVVQALAHGARLDLRLKQPADEPCHVLIDLAALPKESECIQDPGVSTPGPS